MRYIDLWLLEYKNLADVGMNMQQGIPPFAVFSNETLGELCMYRPTNLETFRAIHGIVRILCVFSLIR